MAIAYLVPLTLFCYWLTYLVLRQASDFSLTWPMQFAAMGWACLISPFVASFFYNSLAEIGQGDTLVQYFSIGFIASAIAQFAIWTVGKNLKETEADSKPKKVAGTMLSGVNEIHLPEGRRSESPEAVQPSPGSTSASEVAADVSATSRLAGGSVQPEATLEMSEALDQLERLNGLRESGALSDEEFQQMKARVLEQSRQPENTVPAPEIARLPDGSVDPDLIRRYGIQKSLSGDSKFYCKGQSFSSVEEAIEYASSIADDEL